ncbi:MAG: hypothetical protein ACRDPM_00325 [Solirubrobacteraceae bacterium]
MVVAPAAVVAVAAEVCAWVVVVVTLVLVGAAAVEVVAVWVVVVDWVGAGADPADPTDVVVGAEPVDGAGELVVAVVELL